jgi:uncharacterized protein (DUF302 family)
MGVLLERPIIFWSRESNSRVTASQRVACGPGSVSFPDGPPLTGPARKASKRMPTREIHVQRFSIVSSKPFPGVVNALEAAIGRPEIAAFRKGLSAAKSEAELEKIVNDSVGASGLMEFARFDFGEVLRKEPSVGARESLRLVVGNPLVMKQMVKRVPDAGSYAPVTILVDERPDGVHLSYDRMVSFLDSYGNGDALKVAQDLDAKIEALLTAAAT